MPELSQPQITSLKQQLITLFLIFLKPAVTDLQLQLFDSLERQKALSEMVLLFTDKMLHDGFLTWENDNDFFKSIFVQVSGLSTAARKFYLWRTKTLFHIHSMTVIATNFDKLITGENLLDLFNGLNDELQEIPKIVSHTLTALIAWLGQATPFQRSLVSFIKEDAWLSAAYPRHKKTLTQFLLRIKNNPHPLTAQLLPESQYKDHRDTLNVFF